MKQFISCCIILIIGMTATAQDSTRITMAGTHTSVFKKVRPVFLNLKKKGKRKLFYEVTKGDKVQRVYLRRKVKL